MDVEKFRHKISVKVRFNEVDMLGVCNNAVYINYFEIARIEYIKEAGLLPKTGIFSDGRLFFVVRNEINYLKPAFFDEDLNIYTRMSYIKSSSFGYEHVVQRSRNGDILAEGKGVLVHVDPATKKSAVLPDEFYEKISVFDPEVEIIRE